MDVVSQSLHNLAVGLSDRTSPLTQLAVKSVTRGMNVTLSISTMSQDKRVVDCVREIKHFVPEVRMSTRQSMSTKNRINQEPCQPKNMLTRNRVNQEACQKEACQ